MNNKQFNTNPNYYSSLEIKKDNMIALMNI